MHGVISHSNDGPSCCEEIPNCSKSLDENAKSALHQDETTSCVRLQQDNHKEEPPSSPSCVSQASMELESSVVSKTTFKLPFDTCEDHQQQKSLTHHQHAATRAKTNTTDVVATIAVTPYPSTSRRSIRLPPALKQSSCFNRKAAAAGTARRVRGLWNPCCHCLFSQLHDDLLLHVLSYLDVTHVLTASQTCRRFQHCCLNEPTCWKQVHASEYIQENQVIPPEHATKLLQKHLSKHERSVQSLATKDIQHRLVPDIWLPYVSIMHYLQELVLSGFASLTDTHVHVMLMASSRRSSTKQKSKPMLHKLSLEQCPLLTNKSVQYIAHHCGASLEELSLYGCSGISSMAPLKSMWHMSRQVPTKPPLQPTTSLQSLFSPQPPQVSTTSAVCGKLTRLNVGRTGATARAVIDSLYQSGPLVEMKELKMDGDLWTDTNLQMFVKRVNISKLETLDIGCAHGSSKLLTDLSCLTQAKALQCLNLLGHAGLTGRAIASLVSSALFLQELNLSGFKDIVQHTDILAMALLRLQSLQRLSLWRAIPGRKEHTDECGRAGKALIRSLGASLQELDVEGCYFFAKEDMDWLLNQCPRLISDKVIRRGTRFAEQEREMQE